MSFKEYKEYNSEPEKESVVEKPMDLRNFFRLLQTTDTQPTDVPKNIYEQIRIVVSGGNASLYAYDVNNNKWRAATLGT